MRLHRARRLLFFKIILSTGCVVLTTACSVYDGEASEGKSDGGSVAGAAGTSAASSGGAAGNGRSGGAGTGGSAGGSGGTGGTTSDAAAIDADAALTDVAPPRPDAGGDSASDAADAGAPTDGAATDALTPPVDVNVAETADVSTGTDASDAGAPPSDVSGDERRPADADATIDADFDTRDAVDSGPTGPQILPPHGTPIENRDAGGPFASRCANDEVVTGFVGRAGVQTDAIASTCSRLTGGVLSSPRNLPLNGNVTGGNAFTVTCPANHAAVGIVGRYGHNTMWQEDVTTAIGVVCKSLASTATQIVTITGQPALDAGYTSFREDCTGGRYLTVISGLTDGNSLGYCVQQVGGECNVR
jgi:hypothetical protein